MTPENDKCSVQWNKHSFIHSKYSLRAYYEPVPCAWEITVSKTEENSYSHRAYVLLGRDRKEISYGAVLTNMVITSHVQLLKCRQLI